MNNSFCTIRNYLPDDFNNYFRLRFEADQFDQPGRFLSHQALSESLNRPKYSPAKDLFLAESEEKILGFCDTTYESTIGRDILSFQVHPEHRRKGIATRLFKYALERARECGARVAQAGITKGNRAAVCFLLSQGFVYVHRFLELGMEPVNVEWAGKPGIISRNLESGEEDKLMDIQNRIFTGSWGFNPNTIDEITHRVSLNGCSPEDIILSYDGDRLMGYCWTTIGPKVNLNTGENRGRIHMMGVDQDYRGKGFGMAVLSGGLRRLKEKGIQYVEVTVDSGNRPACSLYISAGFEVRSYTLWYEKALTHTF